MFLWIKAFHIIAVVAWMAGLFYLPRLFVYHCKAEINSVQSETFKVMERRLLRAIMTPAMVVSWILGLILVFAFGAGLGSGDLWFHVKVTLVVALSGFHFYLAACVRAFAADVNRHSERHYRLINEVPTLLLIGIVILVVVKPF